jgi:hypothetical protein
MMLCILELVFWIGVDPLLLYDGLVWLVFFFMVAYLWLMELWGYEFMALLDVLIDSCEMLFNTMVYHWCVIHDYVVRPNTLIHMILAYDGVYLDIPLLFSWYKKFMRYTPCWHTCEGKYIIILM